MVLRANSLVWVNGNPLDVEGYYVKVEIAQDALGVFTAVRAWYGVVVVTNESRSGRQGQNGEIGEQVFECRGLEYLLQRTIVDTSTVAKAGDTEVDINRGIAFNMGSGHGNESMRIGNRHATVGNNDAFIFSETISDDPYIDDTASLWSAADIVKYLLHYHPPKDRTQTQIVPFDLIETSGLEILQKFFPTQTAHEKSVKQILDELIDRRRIMTWWLEVDPDDQDERPTLRICTFNTTDLTLPSGQVVTANPNQANWFTDDDGLVVSFSFVKDDSSKFHQVIARGEPLGACFTVANTTYGNLEADWDTPLEAAYDAGASGATGYAALEDWEKDSAHQAFRNTDRFKKVYRYFRVPPDWNGEASGEIVFRGPDSPGLEALPHWTPGLRFGPLLPLLTETDYASVTAITSEMLEGSKPEYRRPFALIFDDSANRYYHMDKLSYGQELEDGLRTNGRTWSAHLRMQDDAFGVIVDVSGIYQHVIASADFTAADANDFYDTTEALDWRDVYCTVFCEYDGFAEAKYPLTVTVDDDVVKTLRLHVPNARLDYIVPETIVGVDDEGALQRTSGGYVRDDRDKLKDVARSSYEWYSTSRRSITAVYRSLIFTQELGNLILNTGNVNNQVVSNSVVTALTFNLLQNTTTIQTQFAQLDLSAF